METIRTPLPSYLTAATNTTSRRATRTPAASTTTTTFFPVIVPISSSSPPAPFARTHGTTNPFLSRCLPRRGLGGPISEGTAFHSPTPPSPPAEDPRSQRPVPSAHNRPPSSSTLGMVFDVGPSGSWDGCEVGSPVVKRYVSDDQERWLMWYHGADETGHSIGLAVSNNGIHWERGPGPVAGTDDAGQVMRRSNDWWAFDTHRIRPSEALIMSSAKLRVPTAVYWLYYSGSTSEQVESSGAFPKWLPGLAISQDGRHWARIEGEHHSGALFDVGSAGEWDSLFVATPKVVYHGRGDLRMYYHSFDPGRGEYAIGIARSRDGIRWVKLGKLLGAGPPGSFDEAGVRNGHVVMSQKDGGYVMAYEGVSAEGRTSVGLAVSSDGLKEWRRCGDEAVLKPGMVEEEGWDSSGVGEPCLVPMSGRDEWRLYYKGMGPGGRTAMGMAVLEGGDELRTFKRWTGFQL